MEFILGKIRTSLQQENIISGIRNDEEYQERKSSQVIRRKERVPKQRSYVFTKQKDETYASTTRRYGRFDSNYLNLL